MRSLTFVGKEELYQVQGGADGMDIPPLVPEAYQECLDDFSDLGWTIDDGVKGWCAEMTEE